MSWLQAGAAIGGAAMSFFGSRASAGKSRAWQEKMYKNRWRYSVRDMKKAGINPILAAGGGLGGPGSAGPGAQAPVPDFGSIASKAADVSNKKKLIGNMDEGQLRLMREQGYQATSAANTARMLGDKFRAETKLIHAQIPGAELERDIDNTTYGKWVRYANRSLPIVTTASGLIGQIPKFRIPKPKTSHGSKTTRTYEGGSQTDTTNWSNY